MNERIASTICNDCNKPILLQNDPRLIVGLVDRCECQLTIQDVSEKLSLLTASDLKLIMKKLDSILIKTETTCEINPCSWSESGECWGVNCACMDEEKGI